MPGILNDIQTTCQQSNSCSLVKEGLCKVKEVPCVCVFKRKKEVHVHSLFSLKRLYQRF